MCTRGQGKKKKAMYIFGGLLFFFLNRYQLGIPIYCNARPGITALFAVSSAVGLLTSLEQVSKQLSTTNATSHSQQQEAGDPMRCILTKCPDLKKTSISRVACHGQQNSLSPADTPHSRLPSYLLHEHSHLSVINSFSFHSIPCIAVGGIHRHQLQLSQVNLLTPSTANERKKDPFKNATAILIVTRLFPLLSNTTVSASNSALLSSHPQSCCSTVF